MIVRPYREDDAAAWDAFCTESHQATFLHTRRFLSYHGDRFRDASLILEDDGRWLGLLPAALSPNDESCVISHPGLSYGGIVHQGALRGECMIETMQAICSNYAGQGYTSLIYKPVPHIYHRIPAQDDLYALFRLNANRLRCELTSTIDLAHRRPVSSRRKRCRNKAARAGVRIEAGTHLLPRLWPVLTHNLNSRHGVDPVHTLDEITQLAKRFPNEIACLCGMVDGAAVAGVLIFSSHNADHAQYIAASELGREICALDSVLEYAIDLASRNDKRWFDFGNSNEKDGKHLNDGLYRFKSEFGGGGMTHDFFELHLS